ncbi:MAG: aldehyde dehydrogenase family protein [Orrella sp.]|jgi:acyl-CoA reductase-like NAD-dependent aldehyde dehydrogenase|nr:MAG: aldehyde dehydrogenase [Acidimicrobium sp. BACL17 MAG-120823-bin42]
MTLRQLVSPIDGSVFAERELASDEHIDRVLSAANAAGKDWRTTPISRRIQIIEAMVQYMEANASDIATELTWQMGRPLRYTPNEILRGFQERARYMASIAEESLSNIAVPQTSGISKFIRREPLGTVLVVAPWNYPYLTAVNSIVPALLAGNTVVLKHATQTMLCAERLASAFAAAGLPDGVFQYVHASHESVGRMIHDSRVNFVVFTGSVDGGKSMEQFAAGRFIGVGTELGGKDPSYVRADADLAFAIAENVDGAFFNSGQSCCAIERIYVHESQFDDFVDGFVNLAREYKLGNPLDPETTIGPMVNAAAATFVRSQIRDAQAQGAVELLGESQFENSVVGTPYLGPTVLTNVDHSMSVMRDESFGPVIGIMKVSSDAEAIAEMNDSQYGLSASIWTSDQDAAIRIGEQTQTGTVFMNRCDYVDPALVWTGVKETGRGIALSALGFDSYTQPKSFHLKSV